MQHRFLLLVTLIFAVTQYVWAQSYEEGKSAFIDGDYEKAVAILKPLAEGGHPEAQKFMGIMYDHGYGVAADPAQALIWYKRSAEHGQPAVQYQIGAKYFRGDGIEKNYQEAVKWWQLAADEGQMDAQFNLGLMYRRGLAIERDDAKAVELFKQAAEQGHSLAQYSLAVMYSFGHGVEKSYETALSWYRKAAEQGVAQAQYNIGVFYENGYGTEKDLATAIKWYRRASAQGQVEAKKKLDTLKSAGVMMEHEPVEPVNEYSIDEILPDGIKREEWVLKQRPDTYTIQIMSLTNEKDIVNFIRTNKLESDVAYIEVVIKGTTRYNVYYGIYDQYEEAQQAASALPARLRNVKPWVRNFGILQGMLN